MAKAFINKYLIPYWVSFPDDTCFPIGIGVTAFSLEDAYSLFEEFGIDCHKRAKKVKVQENIKWDELPFHGAIDRPNIGPMVVRGIWWPHLNSC